MTKTTLSSKTLRTKTAALILSSLAFSLTSCASKLPQIEKMPDLKTEQKNIKDQFGKETAAIERVTVPKSSMKPFAQHPPVPSEITSQPIDIGFPVDNPATLNSLVLVLASRNIQISFQWSDPTQGDKILSKKLPFLSFKGTIGELLSTLRNGVGLVSWYEDGMIYLSDQQRYSVTLPQNDDILKAVSAEVKSLGADNVVTSLRGGKLLYTATPSVEDDLIGPFLDRMSRNLSVINMQVAVVSLALTDNTNTGFDWESFKVAFDSTAKTLSDVTAAPTTAATTATGTTTGTTTSTTTTSTNGTTTTTASGGFTPSGVGTVAAVTGTALTFGRTSTGNVFGTYGALNVASAINFLSTFGHTNVKQNVSLKTLSGTEVSFQSGEDIPYVKNVTNSTASNSTTTSGSTQTDKVETGLKLDMKPLYDGDSHLVTVDVKMDLNQLVRFVNLSAGNQIGNLTQPEVQKQNLKNLVQVQAGQTVVIGGLQYDSEDFAGNEPAMLRDKLANAGLSTGKRKRDVTRNALFIVLRPSVTVYQAEN